MRYKLAQDGKAFSLKDCSVLFYFDAKMGWYDEQGNYFDSQGRFLQEEGSLGPESAELDSAGTDSDYDFNDDYEWHYDSLGEARREEYK